MRLLRIPQPFDHPDFIYELKLDGFRGVALVEDGRCRLVSRNGYQFKRWPSLCDAITRALRCDSAVIDGEIACFDGNGATDFYGLMFGRRPARFCPFDVLQIDGEDLRGLPLIDRKRRLRAVLRPDRPAVQYVDHLRERGSELFEAACRHDLEGVVAKWANGAYQTGDSTSWLKIKNPDYTQTQGRHELFESRRSRFEGRRSTANIPKLVLR